jgi:hypothetical protein
MVEQNRKVACACIKIDSLRLSSLHFSTQSGDFTPLQLNDYASHNHKQLSITRPKFVTALLANKGPAFSREKI